MIYLLLKKLKELICYLKNLNDQSVINVKFKGFMNAFCLIKTKISTINSGIDPQFYCKLNLFLKKIQ
jgi:hypothetical protein